MDYMIQLYKYLKILVPLLYDYLSMHNIQKIIHFLVYLGNNIARHKWIPSNLIYWVHSLPS